MSSIFVAFSKMEDAKKIRALLTRSGFDVTGICSTGAQALGLMNQHTSGLLITGYRLSDMYYTELYEYLPKGFEMLLVGSCRVISNCPSGILSVEAPLRAYDFVNTVRMMTAQIDLRRKKMKKPKVRSLQEEVYIQDAKRLLMERNHISEGEAHRYLQKCSMDTQTNLVETAQMILRLIFDEE